MADPNGPVFTTGLAPSAGGPRHAHVSNSRTAAYRARQFILFSQARRGGRRPLERLAWFCAGLVMGGGLGAVVMAGTLALNGCSW